MIRSVRVLLGKRLPALLVVLGALLACTPLSAREIVDMAHRRVRVPDKITRVYALSLTVEYLVYAIDPNLLAARTGRMLETENTRYFQRRYLDLPVIGGAFGNGLTLNYESLLTIKPDVILLRSDEGAYGAAELAKLASLGIPMVNVDAGSVTNYADSFDFLGRLLGREQRAAALSSYARKALGDVRAATARLPAAKRVTVYNAGDVDGMTTFCEGSSHAEAIPLAGGRNPVPCASRHFTGMEKLGAEQVLALNPDAILTSGPRFATNIQADPRWASLRAVENKRVYLTPHGPLSWINGPTSFMDLLGVQWLASRIYPDLYKKDMALETQRFLRLFFGVEMSREEATAILESKNRKPEEDRGMGRGGAGMGK